MHIGWKIAFTSGSGDFISSDVLLKKFVKLVLLEMIGFG